MFNQEPEPTFEEMYPFTSHYLEHNGVRQHYLDEGAGEPVLMVHGNPTWSFYYRRLALALRDEHRVIVPDHVGCGFSDKPQDYPYTLKTHIDNLERLVEHCNLETVTLVMHDWGGAIGMGWAVRHPEKIKRIVILNTAAFLGGRMPRRIRLCRSSGLGAFLVRRLNGFARGAIYMAASNRENMTSAIAKGYLKPYDSYANRVAIHRFVQDIPESPDHPSYATLQEIQDALPQFADRPILMQWGEKDWCFTLQFLDEWRKRYPNAEVDVYPDAGHYILEDAHPYVIPRIKAFCKEPVT